MPLLNTSCLPRWAKCLPSPLLPIISYPLSFLLTLPNLPPVRPNPGSGGDRLKWIRGPRRVSRKAWWDLSWSTYGNCGGFECERSGHRNGSACDIINHGELPSAWISVSQTVKGWERPMVGWGGKWFSEIDIPKYVIGRKLISWLIWNSKKYESWR